MAVLVFIALAVLVGSVAWRPHGLGPALGALAAVALAALGGAVQWQDVPAALGAQWRAYVTLASVMTMTAAAERMGLLDRLAAIIEPRTRGPVRQAFRVTFVLSAVMASVLSNDAAILLMTPTVLVLLRTVYPRRNPKFLVAFSVAVFASAGVAPLVISNPMNLIFAEHAGIDFNRYSMTMIRCRSPARSSRMPCWRGCSASRCRIPRRRSVRGRPGRRRCGAGRSSCWPRCSPCCARIR